MNKKLLGMLLLLVILVGSLGSALTASAEEIDSSEATESISLDDINRDEVFGDMSELGFEDGIMWMPSVFDGRDGIDSVETIADMEKMHIMSAELKPGHFYLVTLVFVADIDTATPEKYENVYLQVRFPTVLFKNSVNAIGSAIHGDAISTKSDSFGITADEDIMLYYIQDSATIDCFEKQTDLTPDGAEVLFASKQGIPLDEALAITHDFGGQPCAMFEVRFLIYAAELSSESDVYFYRGDSDLTYWAGRKLMHDTKDSTAPSSYPPRIVTMDEDGTVHFPADPRDAAEADTDETTETVATTEKSNFVLIIAIGAAVLALGGYFIFAVTKVRKTAHEQGITGFKNIFVTFMNGDLCADDDEDDDYYEDLDGIEDEAEDETADTAAEGSAPSSSTDGKPESTE